MFALVLPQGPAWGSLGPENPAIAPCRGGRGGLDMRPYIILSHGPEWSPCQLSKAKMLDAIPELSMSRGAKFIREVLRADGVGQP